MRFFFLVALLLSVAFAAPLADEAAIDALVETTVASEEAAPVAPAETAEEPEAPAEEEQKTEEAAATEAPAAEETETEPAEEAKPEAETDGDDDEEDEDSESSESEEKTPEAAKEEEEKTPAAAETETEGAEAAPQTAVESTRIPTGATATVEGVTIRFSLQASWKVKGEQLRGYVLKITNGSDKDVCGVTFSNNAKSTGIWNLDVNDDGSFSTKDLHLTPGASANQFGYVSAARSQPTILAVTFC